MQVLRNAMQIEICLVRNIFKLKYWMIFCFALVTQILFSLGMFTQGDFTRQLMALVPQEAIEGEEPVV